LAEQWGVSESADATNSQPLEPLVILCFTPFMILSKLLGGA
jgi:hypothetical protein